MSGEAPDGVVYSPSPAAVTGPSVATGLPSHLLFENSFQLIDPDGFAPNRPLIVALSLNLPPTVPDAGSCVVVSSGLVLPTSIGSAAQPLEVPLLLASPL